MKGICRLIVVLILLSGGLEMWAQNGNISNRGREFWVSYPFNWYFENGNSQEMVLYFSAEQDATVTVESNVYGTLWTRIYSVPAGTVVATSTATPIGGSPGPLVPSYIPKTGANDSRLYDLPYPAGTGGQGIFDKAIRISSDVPIVAYAHYIGNTTSGAAMLLPTESHGYSYKTINNENGWGGQPSRTYFYVIATHDNTVVEITPKVLTRPENPGFPGGRPGGVPFTVTLNRGQTFQVIANTMAGDLTGSKIRSVANAAGECWPVAVFAGSSRTYLRCNATTGSNGDFIMQQCFPSQTWGKKYLTAPTSGSNGPNLLSENIYRILVKDPTTQVWKNGTLMSGLINGDYYHYTSATADYITSDKPIMVAQYMGSSNSSCTNSGPLGDPEMIYLSPLEQAINKVGFFRNNVEDIQVNYVTAIVPNRGTGLSSLTIDGTPFSAIPAANKHSYVHPRDPNYTVIVRRWGGFAAAPSPPPGQCIVQSDSLFTSITYGQGGAESYGYNGGTYLNNLNAISSIQNTLDPTTPEHRFTCTNTPIKLSVLVAYQPTRMEWKLSTLGSDITPNADYIDNAPTSLGTVVVNGLTYYKYTLPGTYMFNRADTFEIPIINTHPGIENCNNQEEVKIYIIVKEKPKADFTFTHTGCTLDTARFHGVTNTTDGYTLNAWNWTFPGPVTASGQDVSQVIAPGTHTIALSVVTSEGCASDTSKTIVVHPKPTTSFTAVPPAICEDNSITFTPSSNYADPTLLNGWWWDFGNGTTTSPNGSPQTHMYPDYGTYTVKHVVKYGNLCISDTATTIVTVHAKPVMGFTYPVGCLPVGGQAQFTSTATTPDGQTIASHNWNFGDANATPGNPNTSTLPNPTHIYTTYGTYTITYSGTTNNGCTEDSVVTVTFDVRPTLAFPAFAPVCQSDAPFSIATGSVTNGVPGSAAYSGTGVSGGMFNPATAGPGNHTITYTYTSTAGCIETLTQTILVHARPRANFIIPNGGCLPTTGTVQFTNTSTIADAQTLTYLWNFDDPNANAGNPNTSTAQDPTHNFIDGTYDINLQVTSSQGCVKDTTITATFSVTPLLAYPALAPICENDAPRSVATATVTNGATGTGVYSGPGTTSAGMFNPTTAGPGNHTITYTYTTAGGCSATITQTILVHGRPRPNFTYPNGGCLPTSGQVQFTNTSTIPDAQTMTYSWNFDDPNANAGNPNTSTAQDPTHNYIDGTYDIVLTATSSQGCVKDTTIIATFSITPLLAYPALTAVCESDPPLSVATASVTNGAVGTGVYSGPGTTSAGMFNPAAAGPGNHTITYTFTTGGNCVAAITQTIFVHARPRANFTFPTGTCLAPTGQVLFTNTSTIADAQTMTYAWIFNDPNANAGNPNTSTIRNPTHFFGEGTFPVQLTVTSSQGCVKDTTINATFAVTPALDYAPMNAICENEAPVSIATATVLNAVTGSGVYSGPGTTSAGMFNPAAAGPGNHTITYTYTTTGGCTATITQTKRVHARPRANFTFTNGCLGTNGTATFTNTSTIADAQTMTWAWNFNDPNANAGNPNTSTAQNPTHNYAEGTYNVNLQVTSSQGCLKDTTIAATFTVTPAITFAALAPVCQNPGATPNSIAFANVTNGVTGTGVYSGPGTNASGMFDPNIAGAGTHTITYTYTSAGGCVGTATSNITVHPRPTASFTVSNGGGVCLGQDITLSSTSTIPTGTIATWNWDLGNSSTPSYTNGNPFTVNYATAQSYTVTLVNVSDRGCFSQPVTQTVRISPLPVVAFTLPTGICMPGGNASFTNGTTVPDNSALSYQWDFGDASGTSTATNPSYVYGASGSYNVVLTAISAFGCQAQLTQNLDDFYDKPIAGFTVSPQELCQGVDNVFTNTSTAPNSTVTAWNWQFGSAGTSTQQNPVKRFNTPGVYDVRLIVTNAVGCVSDPFVIPVTVHLQPVIDAGRSFVVPQGTVVQLTATSNAASGVTYSWTPPTGVSDPTLLNPTITANSDETYTLTATGAFGCTATDFITVKILKPVTVPNIFTPNGDGIHDTWLIPNLVDYPGCTVEVFNRYGQKVFHSAGYGTPWNGTFKGKDMPVGTYYYIIQLENGFKPMTGSITIVR